MIETTSVSQLFGFLARVLGRTYRLQSSDPGTRALLGQVEDLPAAEGAAALELDFSVQEFAEILPALGSGAEFMWPGTTTESAGLRLVLVQIEESLGTGHLGPGGKRLSLRGASVQLTDA